MAMIFRWQELARNASGLDRVATSGRRKRWGVALCVTFSTLCTNAQTPGFLGHRIVKSYWIEAGMGLVIVPQATFDNSVGCASADRAVVLLTNTQYRTAVAAVMHAMASGTTLQIFSGGCYSAWGTTFPRVDNLGVADRN